MENNSETKTKQHVNQKRNFLIWFSVVLALSFSISLVLPAAAQAASLYFSPSSGSYSVGKTFTVSVYVSSYDQAINAASGIISFPQDKLQVISLSKTGSLMSLWVQEPSFSNTSGTINFEGIVLNPGFIGSSGKIISITFKTKVKGITSLNFSSASVLANDGKGTNILTSSGSASYNIIAAVTTTTSPKTPDAVVISSETHPDPKKWYSASVAKFSWPVSKDITDVRLLISKNANAVPTIVYTPPVSDKTVTNLGEGIWYFYVQLKDKYGWGDISSFRLQIDNTPPGPLDIRIDNEGNPANSQPLFWIKAIDSFSGIDFYNIEIGEAGEIYNLQISPDEVSEGFYRIPSCAPGTYPVTIKAVDKAGKYSSATSELIIELPINDDNKEEPPIYNPLRETRLASIGYFIVHNINISFIIFVICFLSLIILGIIFWLHIRRVKFLQDSLKEKAEEIEKTLYAAFNNLRKEVTKQVAKLDGNDVLSEREEEINERLKKSIRNSEQIINQKLKDIKEKIDNE